MINKCSLYFSKRLETLYCYITFYFAPATISTLRVLFDSRSIVIRYTALHRLTQVKFGLPDRGLLVSPLTVSRLNTTVRFIQSNSWIIL